MKKFLSAVLTVTIFASLAVGCSTKPAPATAPEEVQTESPAPAAAEFNPDEADGIDFSELRTQLGAVPAPSGPLQLGAVAKAFENEYWRTLKEGYEAAAKKLNDKGYDIVIDVKSPQGEGDEQGQLAIVSDMVNKNYSALLLSPISDGNLVPGVEDALNKNIPVLNVNDGLIVQAPNFIGPKAKQNGELAAEWISDKLEGKGQVAIVIGMPKAFAARQRTLGFETYIQDNAPDIEIVAKQNADWDRSKAKDLADTWIKQYPDLKAIFCNNDTMALGVVEAVKASGKNILVVGVDGIGEAYDSIRKGEMSATIDSFPLYKAQVATEAALRILGGQTVPRVVWTPQALIDSTNVDVPAETIINWTDAEYK